MGCAACWDGGCGYLVRWSRLLFPPALYTKMVVKAKALSCSLCVFCSRNGDWMCGGQEGDFDGVGWRIEWMWPSPLTSGPLCTTNDHAPTYSPQVTGLFVSCRQSKEHRRLTGCGRHLVGPPRLCYIPLRMRNGVNLFSLSPLFLHLKVVSNNPYLTSCKMA